MIHNAFDRIRHVQDETVVRHNLVGNVAMVFFDFQIIDLSHFVRRLSRAHQIKAVVGHDCLASVSH